MCLPLQIFTKIGLYLFLIESTQDTLPFNRILYWFQISNNQVFVQRQTFLKSNPIKFKYKVYTVLEAKTEQFYFHNITSSTIFI
jgi:hypothetical protein